jgi:hypothetical protein
MKLEVGKIYWLRGGHVLRYHGQWGSENVAELPKGYCGSFRAPSHPVSAPAVGYSASPEQVLHEVTLDDMEALCRMRDDSKARNLDASEIEFVIKELEEKR